MKGQKLFPNLLVQCRPQAILGNTSIQEGNKLITFNYQEIIGTTVMYSNENDSSQGRALSPLCVLFVMMVSISAHGGVLILVSSVVGHVPSL